MYWESFSWLMLSNRADVCYVVSYHLKFIVKILKDPAKLTIESPNSKFDRNLQSLCKPCIPCVPATLGVIERKGTIKISLLGSCAGRSQLRRQQNQTKTTTNGQLTLFCLTAPQIKKKINSTTAILDRTYSRVTSSNKVHSTWLKGKGE